MNFTGFKELEHKLDAVQESDRHTPGQKYLVDLLSDAKAATKTDNLIGRRTTFIHTLVAFAGFDSWKQWEEYLFRGSEFIETAQPDLTDFPTLKLGICFPRTLENALTPTLSFAGKSTGYPIELVPHTQETVSEHLQFLQTRLEEYPFVIWVIPHSWKDELPGKTDPSWDELIATRRILPIWLNSNQLWEPDYLDIFWLKKAQTISGLTGILLGVQYLETVIEKYRPASAKEAPTTVTQEKHTINGLHNVGSFIMGGVINGKNVLMNGDQVNHNNYNNKEHE